MFLLVTLSGCVSLRDPEASQEYSGDVVAKLVPGQRVAQSFISRRSGFDGVQLWLRQVPPPPAPEAVITAELYALAGNEPAGALPADAEPVAVTEIRFAALAKSFPVTVRFPAQPGPPGQAYLVMLTLEEGEVNIFGRLENAYPGGQMFLQGEAQDADLGFRASYDYNPTEWLADLQRVAGGAWLVLPLLLVLWVPGRLLLTAYFRKRELDWGMRLGLSLGVSLALIPVAMLWSGALGLRWTQTGVIAAFAAAAVALAVILWQDYRRRLWRKPDGLDLALMAVFIATLGVRLVMARDLAAPPWVDPVHHAVITRAIVDAGRFPADYLPYVDAGTASYHPGFHATLAVFHWLSQMEIADAMLLFGQVQNALITLAVYLAAVALSRDRLTGVLAALAAGLFSPMPAYYLSWGRYTQLAGTLILPAAMLFIQDTLDQPGRRKIEPLAFAALAAAGTFLTHYRVTVFLAAWLAAFLVAEALRRLHLQPLWRSLPEMLLTLGLVAAAAVVLTLPWWPALFDTMVAPALEAGPRGAARMLRIEWHFLNPAYGRPLMWMALLGLLVSIARLGWFGPTLLLWVGLLFISAGQGMIRLPLAGNVNKTSVEIFLFFPITVLAGYFAASLIHLIREALPRRWHLFVYAAAALSLVILSVFGARKVVGLYNAVTILARQADRPALVWAAENLPVGETVVINPFNWGYGLYAGQDGGYWLAPAADQRSLPPPALYGLSGRERIRETNRKIAAIQKAGKDPQALHDVMVQNGLRYVFLGRRGGVISPRALAASPLFRKVFNEEGVSVFEAISGSH